MKILTDFIRRFLITFMELNYTVIKRKVKYPRIEIKDGKISLILPENSKIDEKALIEKHKDWLFKKLEILKEVESLSKSLEIFKNFEFESTIYNYVEEIGKVLCIKPKKITFRIMKIRWGSCTKDNKLILNKNLRYLPDELIRYVVIHEMCHLIYKNHRKEFWLLVKKLCPKFKEYEKLLAGYRLKLFKSK